MKTKTHSFAQGSALVTTLLTITILSMICATSLYYTSQNANSGMQTASWQQSLTGAETGVDLAVRALNTGTWTGWKSVSLPAGTSLPSIEPTPYATSSPDAGGVPDSIHYNYFPSSNSSAIVNMTGSGNNLPEGVTSVSTWVTIDQAGMLASQDTNGQQWYRVRATGQAAVSGPARVSASKLDDNLRNTIALKFNRKGGSVLGPTRTIEVILQPLSSGKWPRGITTINAVTMSGSGTIDSFNSSDPFQSTGGVYDASKMHIPPNYYGSHGDIGISNSTGSDLGSQYVYGNVAYSGPAPRNTSHVQGTLSTPYNVTIPPVSDPTFTAGYTTISGNPPPTTIDATGSTQTTPKQVKVNGDFQLSGSTVLNITGPAGSYVTVWVTGQWQTSGSSSINQSSNVNVTWVVDGQIQLSGSSYSNPGGKAANVNFVGVNPNSQFAISGSGTFIGTINAPGYKVALSGGSSFAGALIAKSLDISGSGGLHYDQALAAGGTPSIGNYAFSSWFEDNSDKARSISY
jgi:hypothetical protein